MIKLENKDLEVVLLNISSYKDGSLSGGLLLEELTLGTKRKIQKIHKAVHAKYIEFMGDRKELLEKLKDSPEELEKEFQELLKEEISIDVQPFDFAQIENISTKNVYDFDVLEKIAK